jgi:hypothetical protein
MKDYEKKNFTRGEGVRKVPKKCHVLFEWPLTMSTQRRKKLSAEISKYKEMFIFTFNSLSFYHVDNGFVLAQSNEVQSNSVIMITIIAHSWL